MAEPANSVVLYNNSDESGRPYTQITVALLHWPDPRPHLLVDDHYNSGSNNPYWDADDNTRQLVLSVADTIALSTSLGTDVDGLPQAVASLTAANAKAAISTVIDYCDRHGIPWVLLSGNAREEMGGDMAETTSQTAPAQNQGAEFAAAGATRGLLAVTLSQDLSDAQYGLLTAAERLALLAHAGQVDKAGAPYSKHPERVAARVYCTDGSNEAVAAAWLHDTIEDTWVTSSFLVAVGFPPSVISAVEAVTKRPGESTGSYAQRIAANPLAVVVKRADLADNTDPSRLEALDQSLRSHLKARYAAFTRTLDDALATQQPSAIRKNIEP
ncbi:MAG: HD domain-containing protein [Micrococcales bacterium]|nr:HD domain-containing protein [Micrococcales bacterium]